MIKNFRTAKVFDSIVVERMEKARSTLAKQQKKEWKREESSENTGEERNVLHCLRLKKNECSPAIDIEALWTKSMAANTETSTSSVILPEARNVSNDLVRHSSRRPF